MIIILNQNLNFKKVKNIFKRFIFLALFTAIITSCSQEEQLRLTIQQIIDKTNGTVGVAIKNLNTNDTLTINNNLPFPMQSVYKFPLAMAVLSKIDSGKFSIDQKIHLAKSDLLPNTWSPLRNKYPEGNVIIPLSEIINYTVSQSDNNGCDILFRLLGGTNAVNNFIHSIGVNEISIMGTEEEMHKDWNVQFTNWCKPSAMVQILEIFHQKKVLSKSSSNFLWKQMVETTTGPNRIKGLLPKETIVAHKTGSSGKNNEGLTAAINDVGIIKLPNGQSIAIAVFVSNTSTNDSISERVIADIAKVTYTYYSNFK